MPLTKHRRRADRKGVVVSIEVLRSDRLVRVLFELIPILIENCHSDIARRRDRQRQLSLGNLVENDRQVILQVEPRSSRPNDHEGRSIRREQRSRSDLILRFHRQIEPTATRRKITLSMRMLVPKPKSRFGREKLV